MGAWSRKIFDNDTTSDIKDTYIEFLKSQYSDEEAYELTYQEFKDLIGSDEEPLFWYAISAVQWQVGRLMEPIKEKALFWIEHNGGLDLWNNTKQDREKWSKTLLELKDMMTSETPKKKEFKNEEFETNLWNVGDVYAYQLNMRYSKDINLDGKYILLHKIAEDNSYVSVVPRIQIYNRIFDELPSIDVVKELSVLPFANATSYLKIPTEDRTELPLNVAVIRYKKRDYVKKYFTYIGNTKKFCSYPIINFNLSNCYWHELEECICDFLPSWEQYDYFMKNNKIKISYKKRS